MTEAEARTIRIHTAANFFLSSIRNKKRLAKMVKLSEESLTSIIGTPEWKQALKFWTDTWTDAMLNPKIPLEYDHDSDEPMVIKE